MKKILIKIMAQILPDNCPFTKWFGVELCKINPWYQEVIEEKMRLLGY